MGKYKPPKTRIRVEKSDVQSDYWPQYKCSWISPWTDFNIFNGVHSEHARLELDLKIGSLSWAKATIDHYLKERKADWEHENNRTTEYIIYP